MVEIFTFGLIIKLLFTIFLIYIVNNLFIKPFLLLRFYEKQGVKAVYGPIVSFITQVYKDQKKYKDSFYTCKRLFFQDKDSQGMCFTFGNSCLLNITDPEVVKDFFTKQELYYKSPLSIANIKRLLGSGIAFSEGQEWQKKRKIISSVFNYEFLNEMIPIMKEVIQEQLNDNYKDKQQIDVIQFFTQYTSQVILRLFFSAEFNKQKFNGKPIFQALIELISDVQNQTQNPLYPIFGAKVFELGLTNRDRDINNRIKGFRALILKEINEKLEFLRQNKEIKKTDLIAVLYENQLISNSDKNKLNITDLADEFATFYLAGTDTTAHLLLMSIWYLTQNRRVYDKLMAEVNEHIKTISDINKDSLSQLKYMKNVLDEVGRVYGPGSGVFPRYATKDHVLADKLKIKKGTNVSFLGLAMNYNPKYFDDPFEFLPERWDENHQSKQNLSKNAFIYVPFSSGKRNCIGQHLAFLEAKIALTTFLITYSFDVQKDYDMVMAQVGFLYEPLHPLVVDVQLKK